MFEMPGYLGSVGDGSFEAIHADWPAYPGDRSWEVALMRLGDFPEGTDFLCIDVIDQCALLMAEYGEKDPDHFSDKHMHVAVRLEELIELDDRGLVAGVEFDAVLSPEQMHLKRTVGPELWEKLRSGEEVLGALHDGEFIPFPLPADEDPWDEWEEPYGLRTSERLAIFPELSSIRLLPTAQTVLEDLGRQILDIPDSIARRVDLLLTHGLFDAAVRDLGVALESRMRAVTNTTHYGQRLVETYTRSLLDSGQFLPARVKSLRQELRAIFRFVRNEFAHNLVELSPGRGYALASRMCWHVRDAELVSESLGRR